MAGGYLLAGESADPEVELDTEDGTRLEFDHAFALCRGLSPRRGTATLRARHAAGLSVEMVGCSAEVLHDDRVGLFLRLTYTLDDGDTFEMSDILRALNAH